MIKAPLVSILVGFFNAERFLEETIASVFSQTFEDWELILVDDGSSDDSSRIAQRYAAEYPVKIHYLTHAGHKNLGVCASRNLALSRAQGRFIAILDADDVWLPDKVSRQVKILNDHPHVGMVCGAARYWRSWNLEKSSGGRDYTPRLRIKTETIHVPPDLLWRCHPLGRATAPCPSDMLLRREVLLSVDGFEEEFKGIYQMYEDQAFLAKIYASTAVFVSGESWTLYRLHEDSCCYRVETSGQEQHVRSYYLEWLDNYLRSNEIWDRKTRQALSRQQFLGRYPWIHRLVSGPGKLKAKVKSFIRLS
jgi:glycosyltransferase involved in cell wall biosynthesis